VGSTWVIKNLAYQYLWPSSKKTLSKRIEDAILDAQRQGIKVVGLGNFNKAEWLNHGGTDIVKNIGNNLQGLYIAHGDTLSAEVVVQYSMHLRKTGYWSSSVFITGSTSKIGRAVCLRLAREGIRVVMFSQCKERFDEIAVELEEEGARANLVYSSNLYDGKSCDLWLTGKMIPYGRTLLNAIPQNATVVNFSVPDPLTPALLASRTDILHLDSGLLQYPSKSMTPKFTWLLPTGHIYACLAGCIVHAILGIPHHEVGPVVVQDMEKYWKGAMSLGFKLPSPTSFHNSITMPLPKVL